VADQFGFWPFRIVPTRSRTRAELAELEARRELILMPRSQGVRPLRTPDSFPLLSGSAARWNILRIGKIPNFPSARIRLGPWKRSFGICATELVRGQSTLASALVNYPPLEEFNWIDHGRPAELGISRCFLEFAQPDPLLVRGECRSGPVINPPVKAGRSSSHASRSFSSRQGC